MECEISYSKPLICEDEIIARLLSSPLFYDEQTGQVNMEAFNLRTFSNGEKESYLSLSRLAFIDKKHLDKKGKYIFKKTEGNYIGYGSLQPKDIVSIKEVRLFPVKSGGFEHCGLFYFLNRVPLKGDLTDYPELFHVLKKLSRILKRNLILRK